MPYITPNETSAHSERSPSLYAEPESFLDSQASASQQKSSGALKSALKSYRAATMPTNHLPPQRSGIFLSRGGRNRAKSAPSAVPPLKHFDQSIDSLAPSPKTVHFPDDSSTLQCVRVFRKHGRPIAISRPVSDETETETEGESSSHSGYRYEGALGGFGTSSFLDRRQAAYLNVPSRFSRYPRPPSSSIHTLTVDTRISHKNLPEAEELSFEIDTNLSSPIPSYVFDSSAHVHLESLKLSSSNTSQCSLIGVMLVRNLSFTKIAEARFSLDNWVTTSSVSAEHVETLPSFPFSFFKSQIGTLPTTSGDMAGLLGLVNEKGEWDRFRFTLRLDHKLQSLPSRVLWLAVHCAMAGGDWWDNNASQDYKVIFRLSARYNVKSGGGGGQEEVGRGREDSTASSGTNDRSMGGPKTGLPQEPQGSHQPFSPPTSHALALVSSQWRSVSVSRLRVSSWEASNWELSRYSTPLSIFCPA